MTLAEKEEILNNLETKIGTLCNYKETRSDLFTDDYQDIIDVYDQIVKEGVSDTTTLRYLYDDATEAVTFLINVAKNNK